MRGYSKKTIQKYQYSIRTYCRIAKVETIAEVTTDNVRAMFFHGRVERHWKASTFLAIHQSLLVFFRWCQKEGWLTVNPVEDVENPKLNKPVPAALTEQEALKLLEIVYNYPYDYKFVRYRNHAVFATFLLAGLRLNELLSLKYADVDIENLSILVRQGKGGKERYVPMSYTLANILKRYVSERKRLQKTCPEFFTSSNRNCGFTESGLRHFIKLVQKRCSIKVGIHKLRHTFATLMSDNGCDLVSLSRMLGHSDIKTTLIYVHSSAKQFRTQITKHPLNDLIR